MEIKDKKRLFSLHPSLTNEIETETETMTETKTILRKQSIEVWMDRLVHNNPDLINKERDKTIVKKLTIGSLLLGPGRFSDHVDRINDALDNGSNQTGYRVEEADIRAAMQNFQLISPHNHMRNLLIIEDYEGPDKVVNQKLYSLPSEFKSISVDKLYSLTIARRGVINYTLKDLYEDAPDYKGKIELTSDNGKDTDETAVSLNIDDEESTMVLDDTKGKISVHTKTILHEILSIFKTRQFTFKNFACEIDHEKTYITADELIINKE